MIRRITCWLVMGLFWGVLAAYAQPLPSAGLAMPPLPTLMPSPIDTFRQLLATNEAGRAAAINARPEAQRASLQHKLQEYLALAPEQRELRLTLTELRWYLLPLLRLDQTNRAHFMSEVPERFRPLLAERLRQWDKLPAGDQAELLQNEASWQIILRMTNSSPPQTRALLTSLPAARRQQVESALATWRSLPADRQEQMAAQFNQLFALSEREKTRVLSHLSQADRQEMERTLAAFQRLSPEERDQCISSFQKFAGMDAAQREQFLLSASRWMEMSATERQAWRTLVRRMKAPEGLPPLPPGLIPFPEGMAVSATNGTRY